MDIDAVRALLEIARTQLATLQEQQGSIPDQEYAERVAYIFDKIETYREMLIQLLEAAGYGDGVDQTDAPV